MRRKTAVVLTLVVILGMTIALIAILFQPRPSDYSIKTKTFSISDIEQWIYEEFQGRRFQMVSYEENRNMMILLIQVDWFFDHEVRWQINEGQWYKDDSLIAVSSGSQSNFSSSILDEDYSIGGLPSLEYIVKFGDFQMYTSFSFDTTTYDNPTHAWKNNGLVMVWKV